MLLRLPSNLHYPITITKVEKPAGDKVRVDENIFLYSYVTKVKQGERYTDEEIEVDKKFIVHFQSTLEGTLTMWKVWEGDVITHPVDVCAVEEECTHSVQFGGMCTNCGKDMTQISAGQPAGTDRANIIAAHDTDKLTISEEEASRVDEESKHRLLSSRKLSLVVDLDQTIIHAAVDPTIAEWMKDPENPNYDAVKDVKYFQLVDDGPGMRGCWYYIKLRPGLEEFLEEVAEKYELHIYTMGTRQYARQIANIVDPDRRYFGDRILSRDESGSMVAKNLTRIFPVDTKMVVIIDDRGDVWKWSPNLIRVTPFDFFVGIGDINSSFLPKTQDIQATSKKETKEEAPPTQSNGSTESNETDNKPAAAEQHDDADTKTDTSALEQLVAMSGSGDSEMQEIQSKGQEEVISSQLEDKPLLRLQQKLDERSEAEAAANGAPPASQKTESDSGDSTDSETGSPGKRKARHSVLRNDDEELIHLQRSLSKIHERFFGEYDRKRLSNKGGRVSALAGKKKAPLPGSEDDGSPADLQLVPDVKKIIPALKSRVLGGVVIVFSGVLPLGTDIQTTDISIWAKSFGASIADKVTREVTHVIAARVGTAKVKAAVKRNVKVVGTQWLIDSIQRWRKLEERAYLLPGIGQTQVEEDRSGDVGMHDLLDDKKLITPNDFLLSSSESELTGAEENAEENVEDDGPKQPLKKKLRIDVHAAAAGLEEGENEFVDDGSPVTIKRDEWDDMDAEFKEFMGDDMESESDTDSVRSSLSFRERRAQKRKREDEGGDEGDNDEGNQRSTKDGVVADGGTSLARPVFSRAKGSALKAVANAAGEGDGNHTAHHQRPASDVDRDLKNGELRRADVDGRDVGVVGAADNGDDTHDTNDGSDSDSDDDLARALERELDEADAKGEAA